MTSKEEVESFLEGFKVKMNVWGVLFRDDRGKNTQALLDLELRPVDREKILQELDALDFCEGPILDTMYGGSSLWVFGKTIKKEEVYIKITLGIVGSSTICISFHIAEYPMNYAFK